MVVYETFPEVEGIARVGNVAPVLGALLQLGQRYRITDEPDGPFDAPRVVEEWITSGQHLRRVIASILEPLRKLAPEQPNWEIRRYAAIGTEYPNVGLYWHNDENFFSIASNILPTEIVCVQKDTALSCVSTDVEAVLGEHGPDGLSDAQVLKKGGIILPLQSGVLFSINGRPWHRAVANTTDQAEQRVAVTTYNGSRFIHDQAA